MELLARQFTERVQSLKQCVELQDMMYSSDGMGLLLNLETEIGELDKMMQELNNLITERKKSLKTAEVKWILNNELFKSSEFGSVFALGWLQNTTHWNAFPCIMTNLVKLVTALFSANLNYALYFTNVLTKLVVVFKCNSPMTVIIEENIILFF